MKYLIAGLGNIGSEYVDTRHNIGFMVIQRLAEKFNITPELGRYAYAATARHKGRQLHLIMPTTYMNVSGKAVRYHLNKHKLTPDQLLVITDDIALPFGKLRMRARGSNGGHNGLKDIQDMLGTTDYPRLRFGVGNNFSKGQQVKYVLAPFTEDEFIQLHERIDIAVDGILSFATIGIDRTMTQLNRK
ncbi:MAG: aminoacyl-tRNA hydrolase [Bacteroidota bacterium]